MKSLLIDYIFSVQYELEDTLKSEDTEYKPPTGELGDEETSSAVPTVPSNTQAERQKKVRSKAPVVIQHLDIIKDDFWERRPWILSGRPGRLKS